MSIATNTAGNIMNVREFSPEIANQWHECNTYRPEDYNYNSSTLVWWLCPVIGLNCNCPHKYQCRINDRTKRDRGCSYCSRAGGRKFCIHESLAGTHKELIKEWHPTKNGDLTPKDITHGSKTIVWWLCTKALCGCPHEWGISPNKRTGKNGTGCPQCANRSDEICFHKSILYTDPDIAAQWDYENNETLDPRNLSRGSNRRVNWYCTANKKAEEDETIDSEDTCRCEHRWEASIDQRTLRSSKCPFCNTTTKCEKGHSSIKTTHKELSAEWNPRNTVDINSLSHGSDVKCWWICSKGHEWESTVSNRACHNKGCPRCVNKTEKKLFDFLSKIEPTLVPQFKRSWCKKTRWLPFDFVLPEDKIIIELDGPQHFKQISNWCSPESTQENDKFKMDCAREKGYSVIRLTQEDVFNDSIMWRKMLLESIEEIRVAQDEEGDEFTPMEQFIAKKGMYNSLMKLLEEDEEQIIETENLSNEVNIVDSDIIKEDTIVISEKPIKKNSNMFSNGIKKLNKKD